MVAQNIKDLHVEQIQCRIGEQMLCGYTKTYFQNIERSHKNNDFIKKLFLTIWFRYFD